MLIFESRSERIIYMVWLPDAQHLSLLLGEPQGLSLVLAEVKESTPVRIVTTGMPLYFDWGARADEVALHTLALDPDRTEQVALMSLTPTSQGVVKVLSSGRTPFKNPAWSPDGKHLAYIANDHAESNIIVADADASHPRSVVSLPVGENSFVWAPDSAHLAYATALTPQDPTYHGIKLVDVASANSKWLTKDDVAAFFFAPDSRHLAYIGVPEDKPYYSWSVVDVKTGARKGDRQLPRDAGGIDRVPVLRSAGGLAHDLVARLFVVHLRGRAIDWIAGQGARNCAGAVGVDRADRRQRPASTRKRSARLFLSGQVTRAVARAHEVIQRWLFRTKRFFVRSISTRIPLLHSTPRSRSPGSSTAASYCCTCCR